MSRLEESFSFLEVNSASPFSLLTPLEIEIEICPLQKGNAEGHHFPCGVEQSYEYKGKCMGGL
jgi:hypothetical protein